MERIQKPDNTTLSIRTSRANIAQLRSEAESKGLKLSEYSWELLVSGWKKSESNQPENSSYRNLGELDDLDALIVEIMGFRILMNNNGIHQDNFDYDADILLRLNKMRDIIVTIRNKK